MRITWENDELWRKAEMEHMRVVTSGSHTNAGRLRKLLGPSWSTAMVAIVKVTLIQLKSQQKTLVKTSDSKNLTKNYPSLMVEEDLF